MTEQSSEPSTNQQPQATARKTSTKDAQANGSLRLTPSSMLTAAQSDQLIYAVRANENDGSSRPTLSISTDKSSLADTADAQKSSQGRRRSSQGTVHIDSSGRQRSFVLWFLIGDLGLRSGKPASAPQADGHDGTVGMADYGGLVAILVHAFGLVVFVTAHLVDLAYSTYERLSLILWFLRWIVYNLTGRTVLAQCVIEAYGFIQAEWALVAVEDHEEKGSKKKLDREGQRKPKGLTRWQVLRGILELYCLHSVTRERYLQEGAGLRKLDGWSRKSRHARAARHRRRMGQIALTLELIVQPQELHLERSRGVGRKLTSSVRSYMGTKL